jgi:arsenate reductase-like glutaredoxin family protein
MLQQPAMIKRPLLDTGPARHLGFKAADYATWLQG